MMRKHTGGRNGLWRSRRGQPAARTVGGARSGRSTPQRAPAGRPAEGRDDPRPAQRRRDSRPSQGRGDSRAVQDWTPWTAEHGRTSTEPRPLPLRAEWNPPGDVPPPGGPPEWPPEPAQAPPPQPDEIPVEDPEELPGDEPEEAPRGCRRLSTGRTRGSGRARNRRRR